MLHDILVVSVPVSSHYIRHSHKSFRPRIAEDNITSVRWPSEPLCLCHHVPQQFEVDLLSSRFRTMRGSGGFGSFWNLSTETAVHSPTLPHFQGYKSADFGSFCISSFLSKTAGQITCCRKFVHSKPIPEQYLVHSYIHGSFTMSESFIGEK